MTIWLEEVVLSNVLEMVLEVVAVVDSPFTLALAVADQLKDEAIDAVRARLTGVLSQMVTALALFMAGVGTKVRVMVCAFPGQFPGSEVGIT